MAKRVDIKTGFLCNNNCRFCVQADNKYRGNRSKEDIFRDMEEAQKTGCTGVVLTGGEVSIREDFFELIRHARELGFNDVQVQTNGRRFFYKDFCEQAVEAGMTEFAPAIHGHIPELHDFLTQAPGSFNQTRQAIKNMVELGIPVIINTVVVKPNYRYLPEIAGMLVELGVSQYQFAFMHGMGNALKNFEQMMPSVSLAAPFIHRGLQVGIDAGIKVMAEAMPYCMMPGYERYVSELYIPDTEVRLPGNVDLDFARTRKESGKMRFPQCKQCRYELICEGPWKEYPERMGSDEFVPVPGEKVRRKEEILLGK